MCWLIFKNNTLTYALKCAYIYRLCSDHTYPLPPPPNSPRDPTLSLTLCSPSLLSIPPGYVFVAHFHRFFYFLIVYFRRQLNLWHWDEHKPLLSPFDFKHPKNSSTLVLGQILRSDLWGTTHPVFFPFLILYQSGEVLRGSRLRWDFMSSSAWCFQSCFIRSGHPVQIQTGMISSKSQSWEGQSQLQMRHHAHHHLPTDWMEWPEGPPSPLQHLTVQSNQTAHFPVALYQERSCIRYCIGSQTLRS